jgi:hypothetical protein
LKGLCCSFIINRTFFILAHQQLTMGGNLCADALEKFTRLFLFLSLPSGALSLAAARKVDPTASLL